MQYFWTFLSGLKAFLAPQIRVVAGLTAQNAGEPKTLLVDSSGRLVITGGISIPEWDDVRWTFYGSTNNIHVVTYRRGGASGTTVATLTLAYRNAAAADNDTLSSVTKS